ncbi:MAG: pyruvate ferredoxin oxidoreductase [Coriobacteriaceae bacterium]|jgi:indolepyruvate ferredoxin oxidoreductase beta subunit|nr:pyruvate ferredoxin oxidoreductase [Coriobacteriaceae bacterium]
MSATTVLLCGVGGQGTILAADLLARAALEAGFEVKVSEIHGMAQRGGAVTTVVRFGDEVSTMVADTGAADCIVSFETTEALRNISFLREGGYLLVADETIKPLPVACGRASMPANARGKLDSWNAVLIPAHDLAVKAGNAKCENVAILGALESRLGFGSDIWAHVIEGRVPPKTVEANLTAFELGLGFANGR